MKVLVAVSFGFISSTLILRLLERSNFVVDIDNHNDCFNTYIKEGRLARYVDNTNYTHLRIDLGGRTSLNASAVR